jgi:hypothetical protein
LDKDTVVNEILCVMADQNSEYGWINLATIGGPLKAAGISPKEMGFFSLRSFLTEFSKQIELKTEVPPEKSVRVHYARVKEGFTNVSSDDEKEYKKTCAPKGQSLRPKILDLEEWAFMGNLNTVLANLKKKALPERWYYEKEDCNHPNPILRSYLRYTFVKLYIDGQIEPNLNGVVDSKSNFAAFNTGIVNTLFDPIYAFFKKNKSNNFPQEWHFDGFCTAGEKGLGKLLLNNFSDLPKRAKFYNDFSDITYDTNLGEPHCDWNHIILENVDRFPQSWLQDVLPPGFSFNFQNTSQMNREDKEDYFASLSEAIKEYPPAHTYIKVMLESSLKLALKRVEWNFRTAIPMYFPTRNIISLLLPLSLALDGTAKVDMALVVEKTPKNNYIGHTILPLEWAYSNARLITKPDSDWLNAEVIESINIMDDDC